MAKFNLTEAAKDILSNNVSGKQGGQDKPSKLSTSVAYGQKYFSFFYFHFNFKHNKK